MANQKLRSPTNARIFRLLILPITGLFLLTLYLTPQEFVLADSGGFPTSTPTSTRTPTGTPTIPPTLVPTSTFTSLPTITLVNLLDVQATSTIIVSGPIETDTQSGFSILSCWPLVVIFLLIAVVIAALLLTRRVKLESQQ
jgi:hypothetical protein